MNKKWMFYPFTKQLTQEVKGILSLMIVGVHLAFQLLEDSSCAMVIGWVIVAVFLFISGYGLMYSLIKNGVAYLNQFASKRMLRVLIPYFSATTLFVLLSMGEGAWNGTQILEQWIKGGNPPLPYSWFVYLILLCYGTFYLVFLWVKSIGRGIGLIVFFSSLYIFVIDQLNYAPVWCLSTFAFSVGMAWSYWETTLLLYCRKYPWAVLVFIAGCIGFFLSTPYLPVVARYVSVGLLPVVLVLILYRIPMPGGKLIRFFGTISYEIYLVQGIAIFFLRGTHIYIHFDAMYVLLSYIVTLLLVYVLNRFCLLLFQRSTWELKSLLPSHRK